MIFIFFKLPSFTNIDQNTILLLPSIKSATILTVAPNIVEIVNKDSFNNISIKTIYINSVEKPNGDDNYNASLL